MRQTIRVNEYYDLYNIQDVTLLTSNEPDDPIYDPSFVLPNNIVNTNQTNSFRGFWNNKYYNYSGASTAENTPNDQKAKDLIQIAGQKKAPQATNSIKIDDNGDIWCYPPNVSVPYWSRIIFRNYDYRLKQPAFNAKMRPFYNRYYDSQNIELPPYIEFDDDGNSWHVPAPVEYWGVDDSGAGAFDPPFQNLDMTYITGQVYRIKGVNVDKIPLFLRFDEYPSRSKVIFSRCDKSRNPDIEFRFAYKKGQMEPIKLNLAVSAGCPNSLYNHNLKIGDIENLVAACYWCIEWIYEPETH